ncbi:MAG: hypothetical protein UU23_C0003G0005 [Candidatus Curtissbacteria bacterium GW2011_GWA1_40_9]|uniref:Nudix hydrolase domain-containing protein n=1 Tax=Candidatus Curtissbacteria bacterium GW2011_GWA1_40_9 TaxID=1618408 RepID=A0A0G0WRX9_9BACT|nr:MAG: hypothetical protein UU23_C0003G0005 [Candidatus Curtissbacteria bacterium GW2011_GWA1_40_9]
MSQNEELTDEELEVQLRKHGIDFDKWGHGAQKTYAHLLEEIKSGETLLESKDDALLRKFKVVGVDVTYTDNNGKSYRLREDRQVFNDGRERRRNLGTSIAEKLKPDESADTAAHRALDEELGITVENINKRGEYHVRQPSESYSGLVSDYNAFIYEVKIDNDQFKPEGYIEVQQDKTSYFVWDKINPRTD